MTNHTESLRYPNLGYGLGLRVPHYETILDTLPNIDWFEALSENYMVPGGKPLHYLDRIREHYPIVMHGVSLSIGGSDSLNTEYLRQLKALADRVEPAWISDHLCWTGLNGKNLHDLLPLPYTEEAADHAADRIRRVQDFLGRRILIENVSSYLTYQQSDMSEWEFLSLVANRADCLLLLDINNIYVSSVNHEFSALAYLDGIPGHRVQQFHLAGHSDCGDYIIDTHDAPIIEPVWDLYVEAVQRFGQISTMIERDDNIPPLEELLDELDKAKRLAAPRRLEAVVA